MSKLDEYHNRTMQVIEGAIAYHNDTIQKHIEIIEQKIKNKIEEGEFGILYMIIGPVSNIATSINNALIQAIMDHFINQGLIVSREPGAACNVFISISWYKKVDGGQ